MAFCVGGNMWLCVLGMTLPGAWGMGTEEEERQHFQVPHNVRASVLVHPKPRRAALVPPREWQRLLKTLERRGNTAVVQGGMGDGGRDLAMGACPTHTSSPHALERVAAAEISQPQEKTVHNKRSAQPAHEKTAQKNIPPRAVQPKKQRSRKERQVLPLSEFLRAGGARPGFHGQNIAPLVKSATASRR